MVRKSITKEERAALVADLRKTFPKGSTVYTILRHVARSGMSRDIGIVAIVASEGGRPHPFHPNHSVARLLGYRLVDRLGSDALRVGGAGMDMGFHIAHTLASALYGDGYALNHRWL